MKYMGVSIGILLILYTRGGRAEGARSLSERHAVERGRPTRAVDWRFGHFSAAHSLQWGRVPHRLPCSASPAPGSRRCPRACFARLLCSRPGLAIPAASASAAPPTARSGPAATARTSRPRPCPRCRSRHGSRRGRACKRRTATAAEGKRAVVPGSGGADLSGGGVKDSRWAADTVGGGVDTGVESGIRAESRPAGVLGVTWRRARHAAAAGSRLPACSNPGGRLAGGSMGVDRGRAAAPRLEEGIGEDGQWRRIWAAARGGGAAGGGTGRGGVEAESWAAGRRRIHEASGGAGSGSRVRSGAVEMRSWG
ncbi:hypothetical protein PVAP13_1NG215790 [Panicum virgatum]|uniref:Uncharacterized protein n=1 Tax=Panicum virgatum TaxID=38727 RepID=A0A8T0WT06_PANVG|nr:hypothetical protein PVAP13_1NG215790 [Panicum virgatum]